MGVPPRGKSRAGLAERLRRSRRLVAWGLTFLVGAAGAELYLRATTESWLGPVVSQRWLLEQGEDGRLQPAPDFDGELLWEDVEPTLVRTNSLGMRGPELVQAAPNALRVLAVGDSMVFGFGVRLEESFTHRLEPLLTARLGRPVVARMGSAPGLSTFDLPGVVGELGPHLRPDVVLAGVSLANDLEDIFQPTVQVVDGFLLTGQVARAAESSLRMRLALKSRLAFVVEHFLRTHYPSLAFETPDAAPEAEAFRDFPAVRTGAIFMDEVPTTPAIERILDRLESGLAQVRNAAQEADVVVLVIPTLRHCDPGRYRGFLEAQEWDVAAFREGALQERVRARCAAFGLESVDLTPALRAHERTEELFLPDETHFSAAGHALVAELLAEWLAEYATRDRRSGATPHRGGQRTKPRSYQPAEESGR